MYKINFQFSLSKPAPKETKAMTWNYRVVMLPADDEILFSEDVYVIREVYYDSKGEIQFWTSEDASAIGESLDELMDDLDLIGEAFERPVLMLTIDENGEDTLVEIEEDDEEEDEDDKE